DDTAAHLTPGSGPVAYPWVTHGATLTVGAVNSAAPARSDDDDDQDHHEDPPSGAVPVLAGPREPRGGRSRDLHRADVRGADAAGPRGDDLHRLLPRGEPPDTARRRRRRPAGVEVQRLPP